MSEVRSATHVKFVQVAVAGVENNSSTQCNYVIAALDDKGRVWECLGGRWYCVPSPSEQEDDPDAKF